MSGATPPTHVTLAGLPCRRVGTGAVRLLALHGLGGTSAQVLGMLDARLHDVLDIVAPDLRAHGRCALPVDPERLGFTPLAEDVEALLTALDDDLAWRPDVLLGVSMGAGIGVELCARGLAVDELVLVRPAWAWQAHPPDLAVLGEVAALLASHGPVEGRRQLIARPAYQRIAAVSPAAAEAVLGQFDDPDAVARRARLTRLPADAPSRPTAPVGAPPDVTPRVHVVASPRDPLHPAGVAETLARDLGGRLVEVAARYVQPEQHRADLASLLHQIAERLAGPAGPPP